MKTCDRLFVTLCTSLAMDDFSTNAPLFRRQVVQLGEVLPHIWARADPLMVPMARAARGLIDAVKATAGDRRAARARLNLEVACWYVARAGPDYDAWRADPLG